jgi:hypothetical protein
LPSALAICLLAAAVAPEPPAEPEPGLAQAQEAAARLAGGTAGEDASRSTRARLAHWAPALRGQAGLREDERTRRGELRLAPLREDDAAQGRTWALMLSWDFAQVVYAREEAQLALAHAHLARVRREAAARAAQLWLERRGARAALFELPPGPRRIEACLGLLRLTAELDVLTALFRDALAREETACALEEKR